MGCGVISQLAQEKLKPGINALEDVSENHSGAGTYVKVVRIPKGHQVLKHVHDYDHLSILLSGAVVLQTDDKEEVLDAKDGSVSVVIKADVAHALIALEDSVWQCIHFREVH